MLDIPWWYRFVRNWRMRMWLETGRSDALDVYGDIMARPHSHLSAADAAAAEGPAHARRRH